MHPVLIHLGDIHVGHVTIPLMIGSYGVMFALALVVGWFYTRWLGRQVNPEAPWTDIYFGSILAGFIGAKLTNLVVFFPDILSGRRSFFGVLLGGGVWLGGALAGFLFCYWYIRRYSLPPGIVANLAFTVIPVSHGIGRIGCLLGGCCYGGRCDLPWAITYTDPLAHKLNGTPLNVPLHPTPIYEMILEWTNAVICFAMWRRKAPPWSIMATWLGLYGLERFVVEFFRGDARGQFAVFSTSQWFSLGMMAISAVLLWSIFLRDRRVPGTPR